MAKTAGSLLLLGTDDEDGTFTGVTTGSSQPVRVGTHQLVSATLIGNGTITGGTVLLEGAYLGPKTSHYDGTWTTLATMTAADVTGDGQKAFFIVGPNAPVTAVRARVSSNITGGGGVSVALQLA
jgi:hypothetical protein